MRNVKLFLGLVGLLLALAFVGPVAVAEKSAKITTKLDAFELGKYQYCGQDSDCVLANNGCCDCANGGEDVAVNKLRLEEFRARFNCMDVVCTMLATEPPCGSGVVACIEHRCRYVAPTDLAK